MQPDRLEQARRLVREGRRIVACQEAIIELRKQRGLETKDSERLLDTFKITLVTFEDNLLSVIADIDIEVDNAKTPPWSVGGYRR